MTTHIASSADELARALKKASGGDVIELAPGDYGNFGIRRTDYTSEIVIRSADPDDPAVFNKLKVNSSSNITFDSIFINFTPVEKTVEWASAFNLKNVSNITLRNSKVEGGDSIAGVPPDSEPGEQGQYGILGEPIARGINAKGKDIVIENNEITHFNTGIVMSGDGIQILDNDIHGLRTSPIRGLGGDNIIIDGNYMHDSNPWKIGGKGDHGDYIHFWTNPNGQPKHNFTITNNVFSDENGGSLLGIYLDDNRNEVGFRNVIVEDNVFHSSTGQAVRFENVMDASISRNTILNSDNVEKKGSQLVMVDGTKNIHFEDNIVSTFFGDGSQQALVNLGFTFNNNLDVNYDDPNAENHIGRILTDSRLEGSGLWERAVVPGSVADGLGSALMHLDDQPDRLMPVFKVEKADGEGGDLILRADLSRGPDGVVPASDALFIWGLGDGTGATGQVVRHGYADAGRYEVTLTVVTPDGTTATATGEAAIMGADMVSFDPQTGFFQAEGYGETAAIENSDRASVVQGDGYAIDLGGTGPATRVPKAEIARLFGAESFDMSMTLRADTPGSTGEVARVHGNFILSVENRGDVKLRLWTDEDHTELSTTRVTVNDGEDHDIRIAFDGEADRLEIYVDDVLAAATDVEGAMRGGYPRDLDFGNPWGKENFDGTLTAFDLDVDNRDYPDYAGDVTAVPTDDLPGSTAPEQDAPSPGDFQDGAAPEEDTQRDTEPFRYIVDATEPPTLPSNAPNAVIADFQADRLEVTIDENLAGDRAAPAAQEQALEIISLIGSARSDAIRAEQTVHDDDALDDLGSMDVFLEEAPVL